VPKGRINLDKMDMIKTAIFKYFPCSICTEKYLGRLC